MKLLKYFKKEWRLHVMLLPGLILLLIFSYYPLYGLVIAFQDYSVATGFHSRWVGLENFRYIFNMPGFLRTIPNTLFISLWKMVLGVMVPVFFSLLLNEVQNSFFKRSFQTFVYMPNFLSWVIIAGVFIDILASDGIINTFLYQMTGKTISFLGDPKVFPITMIVTDVWKSFGFGTVVYLAALTGIDPGLYEAAEIDGANRIQQTFYITLPSLVPIIVLMSVLSLGNVLNAGFDQIYNLYNSAVYETGDIIDTFVYRLGMEQAQYSAATAVGLFKSVISGTLLALAYGLAYKFANYRIF